MKLPDLAQCKTASASKGVRLLHNSTTTSATTQQLNKKKKVEYGVHSISKANISMSTEKAKPNEPRWQSDPDPAKKCKPDAKSAENVKGEKKKLTGMGSNLRKLRTQI